MTRKKKHTTQAGIDWSIAQRLVAQLEAGEDVDAHALQTFLVTLEEMPALYQSDGSSLDLDDEALAAKQRLVDGYADALYRLRKAIVARSLPGGD